MKLCLFVTFLTWVRALVPPLHVLNPPDHPRKPPIVLTFHTWLHTTPSNVQEVSADDQHLKLALRDVVPALQNGTVGFAPTRDGVILDFEHGRRFSLQRFFNETVCYELDLFDPKSQYGTSTNLHAVVARIINSATPAIMEAFPDLVDEQFHINVRQIKDLLGEAKKLVVQVRSAIHRMTRRTRMGTGTLLTVTNASITQEAFIRANKEAAFKAALSEVLGAPIALYEVANEFGGVHEIANNRCFAWEARTERRIDLTNFVKEADMAVALPGLSANSLAEIQSSLKNAPQGALARSAFFAMNTTFCVKTSGEVVATNVSSRVQVNTGQGSKYTIWEKLAHTRAVTMPDQLASKNMFEGTHSMAGNGCIDLTMGSSSPKELEAELNDAARLAAINVEAGGHWVAGAHRQWDGLTVAEIVPTLGTQIRPLQLPLRNMIAGKYVPSSSGDSFATSPQKQPLPASFDAQIYWPDCLSISMIRNQGQCGSCWAVAAASVLADRFCIDAFKRRENFRSLLLAPEHLVDCDGNNHGCSGGRLDDVWWFLQDHGVPAEACAPYRFCPVPTDPHCSYGATSPRLFPEQFSVGAKDNLLQHCNGTCANDGTPMRLYRASVAYAVGSPGDVAALQRELLEHGPVEVSFFVFSDFLRYKRGVYFRTPGAYGPLGGHAVRLLGWGVDANMDYWLCANSWSPEWGRGGFFRIRRGTNECGIETTPATGLPTFDNVPFESDEPPMHAGASN